MRPDYRSARQIPEVGNDPAQDRYPLPGGIQRSGYPSLIANIRYTVPV